MSSPQNLLTLKRHEDYYISSADLSILVEQVQFRVHRYFFERESKYFQKELTTPASPGVQPQGSNDSNAFILEGITPLEFTTFLWVFYNPRYSLYKAPVSDWEIILRLANNWGFPEVKKLAVRELEKKDLNDVQRIQLYHNNDVDRNLLIPRYAALCEREKPLTLDEGIALGMETTLMIAAGREEARSSRLPSGARSPLSPTIRGADLQAAIRELFKIAPSVETDLVEDSTSPAVASNTGGLPKPITVEKLTLAPTQAPTAPPQKPATTKTPPTPTVPPTTKTPPTSTVPPTPTAAQTPAQAQTGQTKKKKDKKAKAAPTTTTATTVTGLAPLDQVAEGGETTGKQGSESAEPQTPVAGQQGQVPAQQAGAEVGKTNGEAKVEGGEANGANGVVKAKSGQGEKADGEKNDAQGEVKAANGDEKVEGVVEVEEEETATEQDKTSETATGDAATTKDEKPDANAKKDKTPDNTTTTNPITTTPTAVPPPATGLPLIYLDDDSSLKGDNGAVSQDPLDPASPPPLPSKLNTALTPGGLFDAGWTSVFGSQKTPNTPASAKTKAWSMGLNGQSPK